MGEFGVPLRSLSFLRLWKASESKESMEAPLAIPDITEKYSHLLVSVLLCGNPL